MTCQVRSDERPAGVGRHPSELVREADDPVLLPGDDLNRTVEHGGVLVLVRKEVGVATLQRILVVLVARPPGVEST